MDLESNLPPPSQVRRRSTVRPQQQTEQQVTRTTAAATTVNNVVSSDEKLQRRPHGRSVSVQHERSDPRIGQLGQGSFNRNNSTIGDNAVNWLTRKQVGHGSSDGANSTIAENAIDWLDRSREQSDRDEQGDDQSWVDSTFGSPGSSNRSPTSSGTPSRKPSGSDLHAPMDPDNDVATRLAHPLDRQSPVPEARQPVLRKPQREAHATARNDSLHTPGSPPPPGYSVQGARTFWERMFEPEAILLTELLTNVMGLVSTLVENGPIDYAAGRAVGPLGLVNGAQLFHSNWANAGEAPVSELNVLASLGSQYAAVMSTWTGWWASEAADFHSRVGAIAGIASEMADVRDAWAGRNDNPARSMALVIRILSIWAASISTFLSISEAENEGSMAPTYGLSASVLPVVGTLAGMTAEALNRTSVTNQLRALINRIRSLIRRLTRLLGRRERNASMAVPFVV